MDGQRFILTPIEKGVSGKVWVGFEVGEGDNEDITKNKDLMRFLSKRAERSKKKKLIPIEEVEKELGLKKRGG